MKTRIGRLSDTNSIAVTALSFGVASAALRNAHPRRRLVAARLMACGPCQPRHPGGRIVSRTAPNDPQGEYREITRSLPPTPRALPSSPSVQSERVVL